MDKSKFGEKIKNLRMAKGWNQIDLAKKVGKSKTTIANWEQGAKTPRPKNIKDLAKALDVDAQTLTKLLLKELPQNYEANAFIMEELMFVKEQVHRLGEKRSTTLEEMQDEVVRLQEQNESLINLINNMLDSLHKKGVEVENLRSQFHALLKLGGKNESGSVG